MCPCRSTGTLERTSTPCSMHRLRFVGTDISSMARRDKSENYPLETAGTKVDFGCCCHQIATEVRLSETCCRRHPARDAVPCLASVRAAGPRGWWIRMWDRINAGNRNSRSRCRCVFRDGNDCTALARPVKLIGSSHSPGEAQN